MKIPSKLPITAEQSRAARFQLGLTQANVIEQSELAGHKLKNFETGRFVPDMAFLQSLREFYEGRGIDFSEADAKQTSTNTQKPATGIDIVAPMQTNRFLVELFTEFGLCFKGKRQLFWSPKLTEALRLLGYDRHEKTDEEIAAEPMAERELVKMLSHEDWKLILSRNARFQVLDAVDKGGKDALEKLLEELAGRRQTHQGGYCYQEHGGHKYNRPYLVEMH